MFVNYLKGYSYIYTEAALKDLKKINKRDVLRIDQRLRELVSGHQGVDVKKLEGLNASRYRLRSGNYRVIYEVRDDKVLVMVVGVGHRREIYRD